MNADTKRGVDRANLDPTVAPQTDFYDYACGGWMKANPLKPEYARYGTFDELRENNRTQLRELITNLDSKNAPFGSITQKIGDLYAMGLDSIRLNIEGAQPIVGDIVAINQTPKSEIMPLLGRMSEMGAFFSTGVEADMMDSSVNAMYWSQGGLNLGDRDYYLEDDDRAKAIREAFRVYIKTMMSLVGYDEAACERVADNVLAIETRLAKAAMTREQLRDPSATYNPMPMAALAEKYPNVDFVRYFHELGIDGLGTLVVGQPGSLDEINKILEEESEQALHDYISLCYISTAAPYLSDDFIEASFRLQKVISGIEEIQPRWKRSLSVPNSLLGEAVGQLYVEKYFPQSSKDKMLELVGNLKTALGEHISALTWMSDTTKAFALKKLDAFTVKIGYPDKWRDYTGLNIDPKKPYWENVRAAIKHEIAYNYSQWGKPVDKEQWYMPPQTVNAYYSPLSNEICFPAGILQAPYFNPDADAAENYGAIGVVIGHEMTHGFDDQGSQFDSKGNFMNWWTDEDKKKFTALTDKLADQFDKIIVAGDTHANGRFTLGENIADQGGLRVAYTAYHNSLGDSEGEVIDGFTPDQRFYLSYANVWAGNIREEEILLRTKTDPHSLGRWRVNGTLRNIEPFLKAFDIKEGDKMYLAPQERVIIW